MSIFLTWPKVLLMAFWFCFATPAWAAVVALDACTYADLAACTNCDLTTHTIAGGANYLVAFIGKDADQADTELVSATWDNAGTPQAMTEVATNGGTGIVVGKAYVLANPTTGNRTLRFVSNSTTGCCSVTACSFSNVASGTPYGTILETENTGTTTGDSLSPTLNTGGMAIAFLMVESPFVSFAQGADQTQRAHDTTGCGGDCQFTVTSATVAPVDYTWQSTGRDFWHVVIPLNAPSGRRPITPMVLQ